MDFFIGSSADLLLDLLNGIEDQLVDESDLGLHQDFMGRVLDQLHLKLDVDFLVRKDQDSLHVFEDAFSDKSLTGEVQDG